jgi:hypothetical protein
MTRASPCLLLAASLACDPFKPASELDESSSRSLGACLDTCGDARDPDRAACRLDCETTFKTGKPAPVIDDAFTRATYCMHRCRDESDPGSCRAACRPDAGPVYERLDRCVAACQADATLVPANRATCESTCAQEARRLAAG